MTETYTLSMRVKDAYQERGFLGLLKEVYYVLSDVFFDLKYNIKTKSFLDNTNYDAPNSDSVEYVGARYVQLVDVFNKLPVDHEHCTLLDLGCGKGRAIAVAATHPFRKIIGVEYDEKLALFGQNNSDKMRGKIVDDIKIHQQDATTYDIPNDVNVIYMFNPFIGATLKKVVNNIRHSYEENPRKIHILFLNHDDFDMEIKGQSWLTKISTRPTVDTVSASLYVTKE